jgi:hypothetical protein
MEATIPQCYGCVHRQAIPWSKHSTCLYFWQHKKEMSDSPKRSVDAFAVENGWFDFPYDYDPVWFNEECVKFKLLHANLIETIDILY